MERLVLEFPPETVAVIEKLAQNLKLDAPQVISKALGLLEVWDDAQRHHKVIVERPVANTPGEEFEIDINS